jgi:TonB family protein
MSPRACPWISANSPGPRWLVALVLCVTLSVAGVRGESGPLQNARALYDSASFDEALAILDRLATAQPEADVEEVQRYRALCLLALNRPADAQTAIETVLSRNPMYSLPESDAPPRMHAAFTQARRRLLPKVTEQLYASAKLTFDRKDYALAATQFSDLLRFLDEPDARDLAAVKEYRTLAVGFRDLSVAAQASLAKAVSPPPVAVPGVAPNTPVAPPAAVPSVAANTSVAPPAPSASPAGVLVAPVIIRQQMPLWLGMNEFLPRGGRGKVRVIVDEQGNVEEARIVESVHTVYDALLLSATRTWKYEPAKLDGKPVRYMKLIEVVLSPR